MKALISNNTVAVMLEPIQGEAGVWRATDRFLAGVRRALTKEHGLLLIVDEIQTGIGPGPESCSITSTPASSPTS